MHACIQLLGSPAELLIVLKKLSADVSSFLLSRTPYLSGSLLAAVNSACAAVPLMARPRGELAAVPMLAWMCGPTETTRTGDGIRLLQETDAVFCPAAGVLEEDAKKASA
jgi:hypothetical protein